MKQRNPCRKASGLGTAQKKLEIDVLTRFELMPFSDCLSTNINLASKPHHKCERQIVLMLSTFPD